MDNQHQKIRGYRDLTQAEIDLMNRIKESGAALGRLLDDVRTHLAIQYSLAMEGPVSEGHRLEMAEPQRWVAMAKTDLQVGLMKLTRAVAQPGSF